MIKKYLRIENKTNTVQIKLVAQEVVIAILSPEKYKTGRSHPLKTGFYTKFDFISIQRHSGRLPICRSLRAVEVNIKRIREVKLITSLSLVIYLF